MGERLSAEGEVWAEVQVVPAFAQAVSADRLQAVAEFALRHEHRAGQVTLVITGEDGIRQLNRDFLGIDAPTDVLAFGAQEEGGPFVAAPEAGEYLGDIIISYPTAVAQAKEGGHPVELELNLLIVHGLLHLLGYDHADEAGRALMWARQEMILGAWERRSRGEAAEGADDSTPDFPPTLVCRA